jgi:hypothetical protein
VTQDLHHVYRKLLSMMSRIEFEMPWKPLQVTEFILARFERIEAQKTGEVFGIKRLTFKRLVSSWCPVLVRMKLQR